MSSAPAPREQRCAGWTCSGVRRTVIDASRGLCSLVMTQQLPRGVCNHMTITRRRFAILAGAAAAPLAAVRVARSQGYPARPVRLIVGFPAGGAADITARLIGQWLSERLGQPVVVENRPGAGTNIGTEAVVKAAPDGYTLLLISAANTINATLYERLNFNFIRDIAPVAGLIRGPLVMEVHPSVPARTVPEFIAYAKARPGMINMGSAGNGTPGHMSGELFRMMTGLDLVHVPYRGGAPALTDSWPDKYRSCSTIFRPRSSTSGLESCRPWR